MKKCVLGNGYIGSAYAENGFDCINKKQFEYLKDDFSKLEELLEPYDVVINCIGITDTKWSEVRENFPIVWDVNAIFIRAVSAYCHKTNKKFIHISTGDLYGTNYQYDKNTEERVDLDTGTNYRFSKLGGEKFCHPNDLILRIRLPFDARNHPKNLLVKAQKYTKFYRWLTVFTYVPDLMTATDILINRDEKGIFNIVQNEGTNILSMQKFVNANNVAHIDFHDKHDPNLLDNIDNVHVHNDINIMKLYKMFKPEKTADAWAACWKKLYKELTVQ
jgi:nucleoside-diphosphate-sugar epimerase